MMGPVSSASHLSACLPAKASALPLTALSRDAIVYLSTYLTQAMILGMYFSNSATLNLMAGRAAASFACFLAVTLKAAAGREALARLWNIRSGLSAAAINEHFLLRR